MRREIEVLEVDTVRASEPDGAGGEERVARLVALGKALSDPIRVQMLGMMAEGRKCCDLQDCGVPEADQDVGICVCEFMDYYQMGQSKVSYHLGKLKEAGLVSEERRGKWSFYSLNRGSAGDLLDETARHLGNPVDRAANV